jgi:hypothetical protein
MYIFSPFRVFLPVQTVEVSHAHAVALVFHADGSAMATVQLARPNEFAVARWSRFMAPKDAPVLMLVELVPGHAPFRNVTIPDPAVKIHRVGLPDGLWAEASET